MSCMRIGTRPRMHSTMRTTSVRSGHRGMASMTRTTPEPIRDSVSTLRSPLLRLPSTPERLHQVDAGGEQILPAADERQLRQVDAALRIEHVEESGVARLIARVREAQSVAGGVD